MFDSMELVAIKKLGGKVTQPIDPEFLPPGYGGGGVSSWNDIPDRPFYSEVGEVAILPGTTVEFNPDSGEGAIANVVPIVVGNTYKVYWNGTAYPCTAGSFDMEGVPLVALGNLGVVTGEGATDEPFLLLAFPAEIAAEMGAGGSFMALDGSTSATVSITEQGEIVHSMEGKYLPEGTPYLEEFDDVILAGVTSVGDTGLITDPIGTVKVGNIYNVNWGRFVFPCLAREGVFGDGIPCVILGDKSRLASGGAKTAEPFVIQILPPAVTAMAGGTAVIISDSWPENNSISIVGGTKIHKISPYCLPDIGETVFATVNISAGVYTADSMTFAEALLAVRSGKNLVLKVNESLGYNHYRLCISGDNSLTFQFVTNGNDASGDFIAVRNLNWTSDGTFTLHEYRAVCTKS